MIFKCKMCGGTIEFQSGSEIVECDYCGTTQTIPKLQDEKRSSLYDRANHFRRNNEFDRAIPIYEQLLAENPDDAEAYWSLALCQYGIEYVEDPISHKRIPTVNRTRHTSIYDDINYKAAMSHASLRQKVIYEKEAAEIDKIQKQILSISQTEDPYDVFICYKETDEDGRRTQDSVLATDLYHQLVQEGFKVFFSRISLEDKLGQKYEPYIFAALNSAPVMIVIGTKPEHFNAAWVRNEWSRYLALIKNGEKKTLIPAYRNMDPYDLPSEFAYLQAQDMSKLGFSQDLIRGIKKLLNKEAPPQIQYQEYQVRNTVKEDNSQSYDKPLKRGNIALGDKEWDKASSFFEQVLNINPECAEAYMGLFLADHRINDLNNLKNWFKLSYANDQLTENTLPMREQYINDICKRLEVPTLLPQSTIRKCFAEQVIYHTSTECAQQTLESVEKIWITDRRLFRAQEFAHGRFKQELEDIRQEVISEFKERVSKAQTLDSEAYNTAVKRYDDILRWGENEAQRLHDNAQRKYNEVHHYKEVVGTKANAAVKFIKKFGIPLAICGVIVIAAILYFSGKHDNEPQEASINIASSVDPQIWQSGYSALLETQPAEAYDYNYYHIYDIDENGVPELLIREGTCEADYMFAVHTYDAESDAIIKLGELPGGHAVLAGLSGQNGVLVCTGHMGYEYIDKYTLHERAFKDEHLYEGQLDDNGNSDYIAVSTLAHYSLSDLSGLEWDGNPPNNNAEILEAYINLSNDPDAYYTAQLNELLQHRATDEEHVALFTEWLSVRYPERSNGINMLTAADQKNLLTLNELLGGNVFFNPKYISDEELFTVPYLYYNHYPYPSDFEPVGFEASNGYPYAAFVAHDTVQKLLDNMLGVQLKEYYTPWLYDDEIYRIEYGDPWDYLEQYISGCEFLGDDTFHITFSGIDEFETGQLIENCDEMVVKRSSDSSYGFKVIAKRQTKYSTSDYSYDDYSAVNNADVSSGGYILPAADSYYYTYNEILSLIQPLCNNGYSVADALRLARNECYARHGRVFNDEKLNDYFYNQHYGLYTPNAYLTSDMVAAMFNQYEQANIDLIQDMEKLYK